MCRTFLQTCDQRNISNGAAEMLKMACIKDEELFKMLESGASSFIAGGFQVTLSSSTISLYITCIFLLLWLHCKLATCLHFQTHSCTSRDVHFTASMRCQIGEISPEFLDYFSCKFYLSS